jgi:C1A family cysteine protease
MTHQRKYKLRASPPDARDIVHPVGAVAHMGSTQVLPAKVDMRSGGIGMPPVLDQGQLGSCASNAASNALRRLLRQEKLREWQPSRLYLYWNTRVGVELGAPGDDSGVCIRDVCKAISKYHACDEMLWPYAIEKFAVSPPLAAYKNAALHKGVAYQYVPVSVPAVRAVLAAGHPIIAGIQLFESFESQAVAASGVVPLPGAGEKALGGHAVLICGYDDVAGTFLVLNSWGVGWGQHGYFTIPYAYIADPNLTSDMWTLTFFA